MGSAGAANLEKASCRNAPVGGLPHELAEGARAVLGCAPLFWQGGCQSPRIALGELLHGKPGCLDAAQRHFPAYIHLACRYSHQGRRVPRERRRMSVRGAGARLLGLETRVSHCKTSMMRRRVLSLPWIYLELGRAGALPPDAFLTAPDARSALAGGAAGPDMAR